MVSQETLLPGTGAREFFARQTGVFRVAPVERSAINYGWAAPLGLSLASGYGSYNYSRYQAYCDILRWGKVQPEGSRVWTDISAVSRPDMLDALNVRFLASRRPLDLPRGRFILSARLPEEPVFEFYKGLSRSDIYVYENQNFFSRAFFARQIVTALSPGEAATLTQAADLRQTAVVESPGAVEEAGLPHPDDRAEVVAAYGGRLELDVRETGPRYLVLSEVWNPGWRAILDGGELPLWRTDVALMGAWLPAGAHHLTLSFRPAGWAAGLAITALSVLISLCLIILVTKVALDRKASKG